MNKLMVAGLFVALAAIQANAEETTPQAAESTAKISDQQPNLPVKKEGEQDTDEVITNRKLRAETGAKSKFSFSAALGYNGGTINNPGSDTRPNIGESVYTPARPSLSGTVGMKYKISALQSLSADIGVLMRRPFHTREKTQVSDPSLTYSNLYKTAGIQNVTSLSIGVTTDEAYREIGARSSIGFGQTAIYDFGGSKYSVGMAFDFGVTDFDKQDEELKSSQTDYSFALYPFAEVEISEKLNLRTVFRPWIYEHVRSAPFGDVTRNTYTQSFGLGISVTRDIFLYPNVQFAPLDTRADRTNVGLSANINI